MNLKEYFKDIKTNEEKQEEITFFVCGFLLIPVFIYMYFKMSNYKIITPDMNFTLELLRTNFNKTIGV